MSAPDPRAENRLLSRENILSLYLPSIILALGQGIALPALPIYARTFGVTFGVASAVLVVNSLGSLLAGVPTGFLIDRVGRRKIILIGPIISAVAAFLIAMAQSFPELLIYRFIGGMGQQMWMIGRITTIADTGGDRQRGRMVTSMSAMQSVGLIAGPLVGGIITDLLDIRWPFIVYGVLCLIAVLPSFKLIRETSPTDVRWGARRRNQGGGTRTDWTWLLVLPILMFFCAQFLASVTRGALFSGSLSLYAAYTYDVGGTQIGLLASAAAVVGIPITLISGAVMDRFGRKATIVPGFSLLSIALVIMAATAAFNLPFEVFLVVFVMVNGAMTITSGNMQTLASDIAPADARGRFFGLLTTMNQGGSVLSPTIFAVLTDNVSATSAFLFLASTSAMVALIIGTQVRDPIRDQRARERAARQAAEPAGAVR